MQHLRMANTAQLLRASGNSVARCRAGVPLVGWEVFHLPLLNAGRVAFSNAALAEASQPLQQPSGAPDAGRPPPAADQTAPGRPLASGPLLLRCLCFPLLCFVLQSTRDA